MSVWAKSSCTRGWKCSIVVVSEGRVAGIVTRNLVNGKIEAASADAVILATGGYSNVYYLSTNASGCNVTATWRAYRRGAFFANPCYTQIHPTCIPVHGDHQSKLTLMSESLRNDGRVWVPKQKGDKRPPGRFRKASAIIIWNAVIPVTETWPRDVASRAAKVACDQGSGVGEGARRLPRFRRSHRPAGPPLRPGALRQPLRYVRSHYERRSLQQPDAHLSRPALYDGRALGRLQLDEQPSWLVRHGRSQLLRSRRQSSGASALMQGLADGYFVIPYTIGQYFVTAKHNRLPNDHADFKRTATEVQDRINRLLSVKGKQSAAVFHNRLGRLLWENCGMARTKAGLEEVIRKIPALREEFWHNVSVTGSGQDMNMALEYAGRVADFLEFGELMSRDALIATNRVGRTSGKNSRQPKANPDATMRNTASFRPGNLKAPINLPF